MTNGAELSGVKEWVSPPGKETRPVEMFAEGQRTTQWLGSRR